jgi:general secretion pathway protein H
MTYGEVPRSADRGMGYRRCSPRTPSPGPRTCLRTGFTLIEMIVVIVVLSLVTLLVWPLLPSTDATSLRQSARTLATVIRYLGDTSVTTKTAYRMECGLTDGTVTVEKIVDGKATSPDDPFFSRKILAEGVTIEDVEIPRLGKLTEGTVDIDFGVAGLGEFTIIHLKGANKGHYTLTAYPEGGRVQIAEGYQEMAK